MCRIPPTYCYGPGVSNTNSFLPPPLLRPSQDQLRLYEYSSYHKLVKSLLYYVTMCGIPPTYCYSPEVSNTNSSLLPPYYKELLYFALARTSLHHLNIATMLSLYCIMSPCGVYSLPIVIVQA